MKYYRFETKEEAQSCLDCINNQAFFPYIGKNAKTGNPSPDKQKTTKWYSDVEEYLDGKFGFPAVTDALCSACENLETDLDIFTFTEEEFDPTWFPV